MDKILGFDSEHRFLSNFYDAPVEFEGMKFASSEAAFQAAKTLDMEERLQFTEAQFHIEQKLKEVTDPIDRAELTRVLGEAIRTPTPGKTKKMGRTVKLRPDWDTAKFDVMYRVLKDKFTRNKYLGEKLIATGDAYLEETNTWNDKIWGVCGGVGENHLGKILMRLRKELQDAK